MPNNLSIISDTSLTMSSRQIAEKTGKRHDNIVRDIEKLLSDLEISPLKFEGTYLDAQNKPRKEYRLPKKLVQNLIMGYSAKLRQAVLDYIDELEAQSANPFQIPDNLADALLLAGKQEEQNILTNFKAYTKCMIRASKLFISSCRHCFDGFFVPAISKVHPLWWESVTRKGRGCLVTVLSSHRQGGSQSLSSDFL